MVKIGWSVINRQAYIDIIVASWSNINKPKVAQSRPRGTFKPRRCAHCGKTFNPSSSGEKYCTDYCKNYSLADKYLKRTYGLSLEDYADLAEEQGFVCGVCGHHNYATGKFHSGALVVDHSHITGEVRGLLCHNCNRALGLFYDDVENLKAAARYLEKHNREDLNKCLT